MTPDFLFGNMPVRHGTALPMFRFPIASTLAGGALLAALLMPGPVLAQPRPANRPAPAPAAAPSAPAAATPAEPQSTTASFADWTLRCQRPEGRPPACEISQSVMSEGRTVAQLAIGRPAAGAPLRMTFVVVPNATVDTPLRILGPTGTASLVELAWRRCAPGGCVADNAAPEALLNQLTALPENGRLLFLDASGREATIPFSPRGLEQALAALERS